MITLDEIINGYMLQNELPEGKFARIQSFAIRGFRFIHQQAVGLPKIGYKLTITANYLAKLPCDLLTKLKVYTIEPGGTKKHPLIENSDVMGGTDQSGFGQPNGLFYSINYRDRTITFNPSLPGSVAYIDYLPLANSASDGYLVDPTFQESLIAWIAWLDSKGKNKNSRKLDEQDFWNHLRIGRNSINPFDPDEAMQVYKIEANYDQWNGLNPGCYGSQR